MSPCVLMDAASSASASWPILVRGWYLPGRMRPTGSVVSASRGVSLPPSSASSPRPSPLGLLICSALSGLRRRRQTHALALEHFLGQRQVSLGAFGLRVPQHRRNAVARRLGEPHIARHDAAVDLVAEMRLELVGYLLRKRIARVVHRAHQP